MLNIGELKGKYQNFSNIVKKEVKNMNLIPVSSSNLRAVGYDVNTKKLVIRFHSGTYEYSEVPSSIHQGLILATSKGQYHHKFIKSVYPYRKID
jgi:hypothetical protein